MEDNFPIGTTARADDIGLCGPVLHIWPACERCGKERWVALEHGKPSCSKCLPCTILDAPRRSSRWKGNKYRSKAGYIWMRLFSDDFFYPMASTGGLILEHRLIMAQHLGRCLQKWEFVHHKNGIKDDNKLENLELTTNGEHHRAHNRGYQDGYLKGLHDGHEKRIQELESRVTQLEAENIFLESRQSAYSR